MPGINVHTKNPRIEPRAWKYVFELLGCLSALGKDRMQEMLLGLNRILIVGF